MTVVDRRNLWVRFVSWVERHRASSVFEYALEIERTQVFLWRELKALERRVAELERGTQPDHDRGAA